MCVCVAYKLMSIWTLWGLITRFLLAENSREPRLTRALIGRLLPHVYRRILVRYVTCGAREEQHGEEEEEEEEEEEGCGIWERRCVEFIHLTVLTHTNYSNITTLYSVNLFLHVEVCDRESVYLLFQFPLLPKCARMQIIIFKKKYRKGKQMKMNLMHIINLHVHLDFEIE